MPGPLSHSPADVIAQVLIDLGLGADYATDPTSVAWPVSVNDEPDEPDDEITVNDTEGRMQRRRLWDGRWGEMHGVQVKVRSADPVEGYAKADAVKAALDALANRECAVDGTAYRVQSVSRTGGVLSLGKLRPVAAGRYGFTVNAVATIVLVS